MIFTCVYTLYLKRFLWVSLRSSKNSRIYHFAVTLKSHTFFPSDDRPLADIFTVLPSKKDLPDYYQIIKQPVDIKKIKVSAFTENFLLADSIIPHSNTHTNKFYLFLQLRRELTAIVIVLWTIFKQTLCWCVEMHRRTILKAPL